MHTFFIRLRESNKLLKKWWIFFYQDNNATKNSVSLKQWRAHTREEPYHPCEQCNNKFNHLKALKSTYRKETIPLWTMQTWNHWIGSTFHALNVRRGLHKQEDLNYMREFTLEKAISLRQRTAWDTRAHIDEKPFECPTCNMRFTVKEQHETHENAHERAYWRVLKSTYRRETTPLWTMQNFFN